MALIVDGNGRPISSSDESPELEAPYLLGHPINRVYCDEFAMICYGRVGADSITLGTTSKGSRIKALNSCISMLEACDRGSLMKGEDNPGRHQRISDASDKGLTYNELKEQTYKACVDSKAMEQSRSFKAKAKKRKYRRDFK